MRVTGKLNRLIGGSDFGGSLQTANIASKEAGDFMSSLKNDQAAALLVEAVRDPKLMQDLLRNTTNLTPGKRTALFGRLLETAKGFIPGMKIKSYKGIFPCFLGGLISLLFWVISRAWISLNRV